MSDQLGESQRKLETSMEYQKQSLLVAALATKDAEIAALNDLLAGTRDELKESKSGEWGAGFNTFNNVRDVRCLHHFYEVCAPTLIPIVESTRATAALRRAHIQQYGAGDGEIVDSQQLQLLIGAGRKRFILETFEKSDAAASLYVNTCQHGAPFCLWIPCR